MTPHQKEYGPLFYLSGGKVLILLRIFLNILRILSHISTYRVYRLNSVPLSVHVHRNIIFPIWARIIKPYYAFHTSHHKNIAQY